MANKIELEQTSEMCPEQYWAKIDSKIIGYIRLRWGHLTCDYLPFGELSKQDIRLLDYVFPNDEYKGSFDSDEERNHWLNKCKGALLKKNQKMANHGGCRKCWWHEGEYCYMWKHNTNANSYCPSYKNRSESKELLGEWLKKMNIKKQEP